MDFDLDDPEDALFVLAVIDDEGDASRSPTYRVVGQVDPVPARRRDGCGCAGCGCGGCLLPILVIAAATAAGFGAVPLAAALGLAALLLLVLDRAHR